MGVRRRRVIGALAGPLVLQACGGAGGTPFEGPVARPVAAAGAEVGDRVALDGSTSTPAQEAVSRYEWQVEAPDGSPVALTNGSGPYPWFVAETAGAYRVQLRVVVESPLYSGASPVASTSVQVGPRVVLTADEVKARVRTLAATASPPLPPDATSPTITVGQANGASAIAGSRLVTWDTPVFTYSGDMLTAGFAYPDTLLGANRAVSYAANQFSGNYLSVDFDTDAQNLEILQKGYGYASRMRVVVDGRFASDTAFEHPADGGLYLTKLSFSGKATRHIRLLGYTPYFGGVRIGAGDTIARHVQATRLRTMFLGDSITEGTAGQDARASYAARAAELLGWADNWLSGVGSTGYLAKPAPKLNFRQRYAGDVLPYAPNVLVIAGGINDTASSDSAIGTEAGLLFDRIQADLPNTLVFVTGPWASPTRVRAGINAALKAAVGSRTNFYWVPNYDEPWITGSGNAGTPRGDGNADFYVSADTTHPTPAGIDYLAGKMQQAVTLLINN